MSKLISQPVGQKRLTNVAIVKLQKKGKKFEIACYRNKASVVFCTEAFAIYIYIYICVCMRVCFFVL